MKKDITITTDNIKKLFIPDNSRYKIIKGYKIDKYIIKVAFFAFVAMLFYIASIYDFDMYYVKCDASNYTGPISYSMLFNNSAQRNETQSMCKNPFFENISWRNEEYLSNGEYGLNPREWMSKLKIGGVMILLLALLINHIVHNRRRPW